MDVPIYRCIIILLQSAIRLYFAAHFPSPMTDRHHPFSGDDDDDDVVQVLDDDDYYNDDDEGFDEEEPGNDLGIVAEDEPF